MTIRTLLFYFLVRCEFPLYSIVFRLEDWQYRYSGRQECYLGSSRLFLFRRLGRSVRPEVGTESGMLDYGTRTVSRKDSELKECPILHPCLMRRIMSREQFQYTSISHTRPRTTSYSRVIHLLVVHMLGIGCLSLKPGGRVSCIRGTVYRTAGVGLIKIIVRPSSGGILCRKRSTNSSLPKIFLGGGPTPEVFGGVGTRLRDVRHTRGNTGLEGKRLSTPLASGLTRA